MFTKKSLMVICADVGVLGGTDPVGELEKQLAKPAISLEIGCCQPSILVTIPSSPTVSGTVRIVGIEQCVGVNPR